MVQNPSHQSLKRWSIVICLLASCAIAKHAQAQSAPAACRLLSVADLEAALGGNAQGAAKGETQGVPGMTLDECKVMIAGQGQTHPVTVQIVSNIGMDGAQAIAFRNQGTAREQQWKVSGARLEQSTEGSSVCIL